MWGEGRKLIVANRSLDPSAVDLQLADGSRWGIGIVPPCTRLTLPFELWGKYPVRLMWIQDANGLKWKRYPSGRLTAMGPIPKDLDLDPSAEFLSGGLRYLKEAGRETLTDCT